MKKVLLTLVSIATILSAQISLALTNDEIANICYAKAAQKIQIEASKLACKVDLRTIQPTMINSVPGAPIQHIWYKTQETCGLNNSQITVIVQHQNGYCQ